MLFVNKGMLFENKDLLSRPSNEDSRFRLFFRNFVIDLRVL